MQCEHFLSRNPIGEVVVLTLCLEWTFTRHGTPLVQIQEILNASYKTHFLKYSLKQVASHGSHLWKRMAFLYPIVVQSDRIYYSEDITKEHQGFTCKLYERNWDRSRFSRGSLRNCA
jgi:hypothetical protein